MFAFRLISSAQSFKRSRLLDSQVFVGGSITILRSDIVLKSGSCESSSLCLCTVGSFVTDCSELKERL